MSLQLNKVAEKSLIFDGTEEDFYGNHFLKLENGVIIPFSTENISKLKLMENSYYLKQILKLCKGIYDYKIIPELSKYKNAEDLSVYFIETPSYIAILSLGEFQPGRYKIYQEGIFKKS